jgi:sec-independent protein translocase protein TatB
VFNLSGSEIVFLLIAGLVVLGPERLPGVIRTVARIYGDIRRAAKGLEKELTETFKEPIAEFKAVQKDLSVGFGEVDTEPSPPMRPEQSRPMPSHETTDLNETTDSAPMNPSSPDQGGDTA